MQREILFKGLSESGHGFVFGDLIQYGKYTSIRSYNPIGFDRPIEFIVVPKSVGQFTGMIIKTTPEVKVFVGDRVLVRGTKRVGLYITTVIESTFGFTLESNKTSLVDGSCLLAVSKVIGTIHDVKEQSVNEAT